MRKTIKIVLLLLAAALIILAAVSGVIMVTFDKHDFREALTAAVSDFTDYRLEIIEPFTADFSLHPSFSGAVVKLVLPDKPTPLEIRKLKLKLTLADLLHRNLRVNVSGLIKDQPSLKLILPEELSRVDSLWFAAKVTTNGSDLELANLKLRATNKQGLEIEADGYGLIEDFSAPQPFKVLDLNLKIISPDSRTLKGYLPDDLPELGPTRGRLRLVAISDQDLGVREINFNCIRPADKLETRIEGMIARIPVAPDKPNSGIDLKIELKSLSTATMNDLTHQSLPEIGPIQFKARIRGSKKELSIEDLDLHAGNSGALELKTSGRLKLKQSNSKEDPKVKEIELSFNLSAPSGTRLPTLSGSDDSLMVPADGPLAATFKLSGNLEKISLNNFSANFGQTAITAGLEVIRTGKRPYLTGKIEARTLNLHDFTSSPKPAPQLPTETPQKPQEAKKTAAAEPDHNHLFSCEPFPRNWLHRIDCNLNLVIDKIADQQEEIDNINLAVKLKDGRLLADPATLVYKNGRAEFSLLIDDSDPAIATGIELKGDVKALELKGLLESLAVKDLQVSGKLTAHTELKSRGRSMKQLAANLKGPFEVVLEEGKVPSQIMKLIAIDLLGWSFNQVLMQKRLAEIGCGILALEAQQGLLTVKVCILESPNLITTAAGTVDLKSETCDLTIYPKKKREFLAMVTPVNIRGSLRDPQVIAIPVKSAALLYGGMLLAPQIFLPAIGLDYIWGKVSKDSKGHKSPCFEYLNKKK